MTKLRIIHDLSGLSDAEIEQYKRDISIYFGLNPDVNWFDVVWMNDENTMLRKRQLYARRGTTDYLRDQRKISVVDMTQHDGPGYVSFKAIGKDANGRTEVAVGAHSTEGLRGERLAAAVSTAETRAGRRLTLKFCGLGILDHSEILDVDVKGNAPDVALSGSAMVIPPMPTVVPNNAAGTMVSKDDTAQALAEGAELARAAADAMAKMREEVPAEPTPAPEPEKKPKAPRRKKVVDLTSPGQTPTNVAIEVATPVVEAFTSTLPAPVTVSVEVAKEVAPVTPTPPFVQPSQPIVQPFPGQPNEEQLEGYRNRLRAYYNEILPKAGMTPSQGIGGPSVKMRMYCQAMMGKSVKELTAEEWDDFISGLDKFAELNGAKNLVKYINDVIGAK